MLVSQSQCRQIASLQNWQKPACVCVHVYVHACMCMTHVCVYAYCHSSDICCIWLDAALIKAESKFEELAFCASNVVALHLLRSQSAGRLLLLHLPLQPCVITGM